METPKKIKTLYNKPKYNKHLKLIFFFSFAFHILVFAQSENKLTSIKIPNDSLFILAQKYINNDNTFEAKKIIQKIESDSLLKNKHLINLEYLKAKYFEKKEYFENALLHYKNCLAISLKKKDTTKQLDLKLNIGRVLFLNGEYNQAKNLYFKILTQNKLSDYDKAISYQFLGDIFLDLHDFKLSQEYLEKSKNIFIQHNWHKELITCYLSLGFREYKLNNYQKALNYYEKAEKLAQKKKTINLQANILSNKAIIYYEIGEHEKCLDAMKRGLEITQQYNLLSRKSVILNNIAYYFIREGKADLSFPYLQESEYAAKKSGYKTQLIITYETYYQAYEKIGDFKNAFLYSKKYIKLKDSLNFSQTLKSSQELEAKYSASKKNKEIELLKLSEQIYQKDIQKKQLIIYGGLLLGIMGIILLIIVYKRYKLKEELNNELEQKNHEIEQQKEEIIVQKESLEEKNYELNKLSTAIKHSTNVILIFSKEAKLIWANHAFEKTYGYKIKSFLNNNLLYQYIKDTELAELDKLIEKLKKTKNSIRITNKRKNSKNENIWMQSTITPLFSEKNKFESFIIVESDITEQKKIEEKIYFQNLAITESIDYAKTIQQTILPPKKEMTHFFNHFIIYQPKEIVSGDFYWHYPLFNENKQTYLLAMVDCTGHGVSGAFMSLIAHGMLIETVKYKNLHRPKQILYSMKKQISKVYDIKKRGDGFDIALCKIEKINNSDYQINFSAAKLALYYSVDKNTEFKRIKGSNIRIDGETKKTKNFEEHQFILHSGARIILATDGIIDMANKKRKRFGTTRFINKLNTTRKNEISKLQTTFEDTINDWLTEENQRDDISIWGFDLP